MRQARTGRWARPSVHALTRSAGACAAFAGLAALVLLGGCGVPTKGEFTVLSYNVAGLPQEISTENPEEHIPLISPLLDEYDVVLTQEDFDWWVPELDAFDFAHYHERLRAQATHPHRSTRWLGPDAAGIDPAVREAPLVGDGLGFMSRMAFTEGPRRAWHDCFGGFDTNDGGAGDCLAGKGFGVVTMTLRPGYVVDVYTLHAEAGSTAEDQQLQVDDFEQLADFIEAHSAGRAVIVGGDTNLHTDPGNPDRAIWSTFLSRTGLTDACTELSCPEPGSIDKVAYRSGGGVTLCATSHDFPRGRFRAADGEALSDHPPLVVGFRWTTPEPPSE
jgi:endonuclease/exonuclease/phosphatase (EEP) superfamily protein YafD